MSDPAAGLTDAPPGNAHSAAVQDDSRVTSYVDDRLRYVHRINDVVIENRQPPLPRCHSHRRVDENERVVLVEKWP